MEPEEPRAPQGKAASLLEDIRQVQRVQQECTTATEKSLLALESELNSLLQELERSHATRDAVGAVSAARARIGIAGDGREKSKDGPDEPITRHTRKLHKLITTLYEAVGTTFPDDMQRDFSPHVDLDSSVLNQVLVSHFYQSGRLELANALGQEAQVEEQEQLRQVFQHMHGVLTAIQQQNLGPALEWATARYEDLVKLSGKEAADNFHFQLHQAQYLQLFHENGATAALKYGQQYLWQFAEQQLPQVCRLFCLLLFAKKPDAAVYPDLRAGPDWDAVSLAFQRQACALMNLSSESPLLVTVAAGAVALPTYLKHSALSLSKRLAHPEVELGREFTFHSFFVCPVSREQSTRDNPPMILPCGHVLAKQTLQSISKGPSSRPFKCPTCPAETKEAECMELFFPKPRPR